MTPAVTKPPAALPVERVRMALDDPEVRGDLLHHALSILARWLGDRPAAVRFDAATEAVQETQLRSLQKCNDYNPNLSDRVAKIVAQVCKAEAPKFRSNPDEALGPVWEKTLENEKKLRTPLNNPDAWIWKTAWRQARRAFKELRCKSVAFDERTHPLVADRVQARDIPELLTRQEEQKYRAEQIEKLQAEFIRLPCDQQVAFLVANGVQGLGWINTDLPNSVVGLAELWGCSRQHVYNLARKATRHLQSAVARS